MSSGRFTFLVVVAAVVAIVAVVVASGGIESPFGGGDDDSKSAATTTTANGETAELPRTATTPDGEVVTVPEKKKQREDALGVSEPDIVKVPENPDDVHGDDEISLTRPANLRLALATLDRRRRKVEGVFDGLRVAPGRIDTIIIHPDDRMTNIQVRYGGRVSFENTHDFPTREDFREDGITARDVDVTAPRRMLRQIDELRPGGDAAHDVDYFVIDRDIIDHDMNVGAYMRIRTARPRMFLKEPGTALRPIG